MSVLIKDIQRNSNEIIRIEISEFKGKELINIRIWYSTIDRASGDLVFKPTQKGVALDVAHFNELKDGIERLEQYINDSHTGAAPEQLKEKPEDSEEDETKKE